MSAQKPYRIVHLSKYYPPERGGIENYIQTLAQTQSDLGAEVCVFCINTLSAEGKGQMKTATLTEWDRGVEVRRVGRLFSVMRFDVCATLLQELYPLTRDSNTIIHLHTPNPTMLTALSVLLLNNKNVNLVITHHSDIIKQKNLKYFLRPFETFIYQKSSLVLATTENYIPGSSILRRFQKKVKALPLTLDLEKFYQPSRQALDFSQRLRVQHGNILWLVVGRLVYYKGLHIALEALTRLPGKLLVIGVGPLAQDLRLLSERLGVRDRVVWLGNVTNAELVGAYRAATALLFPSNARSEAFGLVQVEAMASGCPVINADIPNSGVTWVSRPHQEALTVGVNDPLGLAQEAQRLLQEPGLSQKLGEAGRIRSQIFSAEAVTRQLFRYYEDSLERRSDWRYSLAPRKR
ncbi:MAG: glycosyltransferase [Cyanobacteria bacterium RI_101]|nr:glycosyltransferase [Cyanobacteria bacterium RI_101]